MDFIGECLAHLREEGLTRIEPEDAAVRAWDQHVVDVADATLYPRANSWYMGANIPGKPRVFMPYVGGVWAYRTKCDEVTRDGYRGFELTGAEHRLAERARKTEGATCG